jgi:hypothetical protein
MCKRLSWKDHTPGGNHASEGTVVGVPQAQVPRFAGEGGQGGGHPNQGAGVGIMTARLRAGETAAT